jgi:hypothetical protein
MLAVTISVQLLARSGQAQTEASRASCEHYAWAPIPVRIVGQTLGLRYDLEHDFVVSHCDTDCTIYVRPGRDRLRVFNTATMEAGSRTVEVMEPSLIIVDPPSPSKRKVGLGLGIGGAVLSTFGLILWGASNDVRSPRWVRGDWSLLTGLAALMGGAVASPIGWVMFGKSFRPKVEVIPDPPTAAGARRISFGILAAPKASGLQGKLTF